MEGWLEGVELTTDEPLKAATPSTVAEAEEQIGWIVRNFDRSRKQWLYRVLHDGEGIRRDQCDEAIRQYKRRLAASAKP